MAKGNVNPAPSPSPNPNPTPSPSPTGTGGGNVPTGNSGFSMNDSSMQGLQSKAGDLGSRLASISSGLRGLNFSGNALGPIGLFAVPALNASNDNAISQADKGAKAFNDVQANLKATHQTFVQTDGNQQKNFNSFDTTTNAKPPPGAANTTLGNNAPGGPKVTGPGTIAGGGVNTKGNNVQGGPKVSQAPNVKGGGGFTGGGVNAPGGPSVNPTPNIKGGTGPATTGGTKGVSGPTVSAVPNVKGGTGPVTTGGPKPGGPSVGAVPNIAGPVTTGATPNAKGGTVSGGAKPSGVTAPPVIGGNPPASAKPGTTPGGKGAGIPPVPGSTQGPKPGVTPPSPQNAVTTPPTGNARGTTPPPTGAPGMAPPMAPGTTGAQGGERGGSKFGTGGGKGLFDAPKPGTPDSTITKAPPNSASTPPPPPKPATPGVPGTNSPATGSPNTGSPTAGSPKPGVPSTTPPTSTPGPQTAVTTPPPGTAKGGGITPGATPPAAAAPAAAPPMAPGANPAAATSERGGNKFGTPSPGKGVFDAPKPPTPDNTITRAPGTSPSTPPPAPKPTPLAPPPSATVPPVTSPSTPPPATTAPGTNAPSTNAPATNTPSTNTPGTNAPGTNAPGTNAPGTNTPGTNAPGANTAPPAQSRPAPAAPPVNTPAPNVPPVNAPSPNAPSPNPAANVPPPTTPSPNPATNVPPTNAPAANVPPTNTPSPKPDTAPSTQPPKADTPTPAQSRPAPPAPPANAPSPNPATNVPPANTPSPNPAVNTPPPTPNTSPVTTPAPNPNTTVPPANTGSPNVNTPNPATSVPPSSAPTPNTPPPNTPAPKPDVNTPPVQTKPTPDTPANPNTPPPAQTRPAPPPPITTTNPNATPDLIVAPPLITPAPAPNPSQHPSTSATPAPTPNVVPRSHPASAGYQAQPRPDGGKGKKRAALKKYLGINFIKGLLNKDKTPAPAPSTSTNQNTAPPNPWAGLLTGKPNPSTIDVPAVKAQIDAAVNDGKPGNARILINRLKNTEGGADLAAELQAHYDQAVQNKGDAGKVEVPKQLHFAWFGKTPSPESVNGMLEWAAQANENNGWKVTLWTDGSSADWDPEVKQQLEDAGIEIKSDVDTLVTELSNDIPPAGNNTTLQDVYNAAQSPDAKAYNLAADIARYAVLAKNGGVYVDVDIRPGALSLDNIGDMKMQPTDVPLFAPRLRDQSSVDKTLKGQENVAPGTELDTAADIQYGKGELNNNFIVAPPNNDFINKFAEIIPQKFEGLQNYNMTPEKFNAELKAQAPDISGPNVLVDGELAPRTGLIGQFTMDPDNHGLQFKPDYLPRPVPLIQKTDFTALFDPDIKNQWTGLEWVTPESSNQLDSDTKTDTDDKPGPSNDKDTRPAPSQDTPKQVRGGGAPPPLTPPTPESHQGKDVITDESWRHDPAKTADWSTPDNPADRSTWADRRDDTNVRTVDVVVHDVRTDSTPSNIKSYQGLINYDLRRIETTPGNFVQEYTVKVHIDPAAGVDPDVVRQVKENATNGVNTLLNQGFRLPSGDQFHLNLEFTNDPADAHTTIKVDPDNPNVDQTHWNPDTSPEVLAHETLHYLGIPDEYKDSSRVFQQHDTNSGVHQNDGGLMGADVHLPDPGIRPRHLWLIERTANSQVMVPDTRLEPPGPATVPPPANYTPNPTPTPSTAQSPDTTPKTDADTRPMPKRDQWDSDSDSDAGPSTEPPAKRKPAPDNWTNEPGPSTADTMDVDNPDVGMADSQLDNLATEFGNLSLGDVNFAYNPAFAQLANGPIDLPTKDNYLAKLKESVEEGKPPSFVVNMIVSHNGVGDINNVIDAITADAGPLGKDMVFIVGVNGPNGSDAAMNAHIAQANNDVANRKEPVALVPLPTFDPKDGFPFGRMRNGTMHSPATTFAIGALNGKGTHPYISFQDFDTGSRQVPSGKDVFNHFTDSLNPPGAGPIRPLLYSGGYRVGDPAKLVTDTQARIDAERVKINNDPKIKPDDRTAKLKELDIAEKQIQKPDFAEKFQQAMSDDMDARSRQKDSAPLLPYSPEPNLFMDANVAVVDPSVRFSDGGNEFGDLSQSINSFAGKEIVEIHTNQLPKPELNQDVKDAKAQLEADIAAQGGTPSPSQAKTLASLDAEIKAKDARAAADPGFRSKAEQLVIDAGIDVDLQNNRNPYRGETFSSDFVHGAVGTDLSRLALGFAKSEGKSWPQSHVALTSVTNRMYGGDNPTADRAAKADVSGAKIRDEFGDRKPGKGGTPNPKNKPHEQREAQQLIQHKYDYDPNTGKHTHAGSTGGWNPSDVDATRLGRQDKNTLNTAVSAPVDGHPNIGIDPAAKQEKMAAMLNLALSANPSNVTRMFGTLEHGVLPIAADPRPDGIFNAVHDAAPDLKPAKDLRTGAIQKGSTASPAITKQIANFRQEHSLENGHLVTALIEPAPAPLPDTYQPDSGDVDTDIAETNKAAKAEELAAKLLATEIGRPLKIHGPDGDVKIIDPFVEPAPEITSKSSKADIKKAANWRYPEFPPPVELDAHPNPNGKTSYTAHNDPGEGPSHRGAPPKPEQDTRPAPPRPTPNPVVPMTTVAPQPVGQVPGTNLPSFFQDNKALGSITPTDVRGADAVVGGIQGIKPDDAARIKSALENDFETFLDGGRNFQVKIGNAWFEANIRAEMRADTTTAVKNAPDTEVDKNFQAAAASTTTNTVATANDVGASATAGVAMGPYGSLGGKAALATPAVSQATSNTITEQRAIKSSDDGSKQITVPVSFEITVTDSAGNARQYATLSTGPDVTLQVPTDLSTIVDSGKTSGVVTPADPAWGTKLENAVPEAVVVKDSAQAFADVASKLHPSITKVGAPGREVLQNFLSPTSIRNNLPALLGGFVTSPDLVSPHASKGAAVQMTATLQDAKLVGTHDSAVLDLKDTSAWGSSVSATTKTGFDVTAGVGGNIGVPGQVGGTVGGTVTYSARTAEGVNAGSSTSRKTGIGVKNETGLYEVTAEVEVRTPAGDSVKIPVTTHMRMGLHEAGAAGLPTPDGTRNSTTDPATADTRFLPPYLADTLAAGNAKVGEFVPATKVQGQVEGALRNLPGFGKFLPSWNNPDANPRSSKGQSFADVAEQLANQRKLTATLSPAALKANMDSLLGPGVQVQLKNSGKTTNTYVNVTVKAKLSNPRHLGQADARPVSDSTTTGPKLDASTSTTKGWTGGVQGRANIPVKTGVAALTPAPQAGVSYSHSWTDKTTAGPAVSGTSTNPGSPDAQVFQQDVEFEVEITSFTRPRAWVRNIVPGAPGFHSPQPRTVAKTGAGLDRIDGKVNLWVSDSSTLKTDPGDGFKPGDPQAKRLEDSPTVKDLLNPGEARPKSPEFLNVEAVANTTALRDQAIDALNRAAGGDSALTVPGTAARAQIDKMFAPENIKANLQKLVETGMQEQGLKYDRRVTDRTGAIGMSVKLGEAKLVSISDTTGADNSVSGGYKAGESSSTSRSVDLTAGVNVPVRPNVTPPPAGTPSQPTGSGGAAVTGKVTPWSDSRTESNEIGGNVERGRTTPGDARTVLVQIDAEFTIVGESRAGNFVHGGTPHAEGVTVTMPKSVFVRVSEDVARELGALPKVAPNVPKPDFPAMAPPSTVAKGEPGALGLSNVESVPDLSGVVDDLTNQLSANTRKFGSDALIPDSVLKDSMSNLQRIVDLNSPTSVKAMIDSALDGGVPLLVHQPGTFGKDSYQVTLRAKADTPRFDQVVNDGVDLTHNTGGSRKESDGQGRGTGWGVGVRAPGLASPGSANPKVSGTAGVSVGANIGGSTSSSVTTSTSEAFSHNRTASGPAARYTVPIEFELVVEKGNKVVATAPSGPQEMTVRLHADNQKIAGGADPQPYMSAASRRGSEFGTPAATFAFQQDSRATQLPPTASVENLRGAKDLRDAAVKALTEAGAGKGLTGKGTGSLHALFSTLSPENLQPHLPSMLSGPLTVPGLHEAALTFGQDADVKVYAKLVNPRLGSLSDDVRIETPLTTKTTETSSEAKVSETADVSVGLAQGSAAVKQGTDPKDTVNFGTGGVELRHAQEDSAAVSGGPAQAEGGNIKPKDTSRSGLVQFDVEYRVVATIGGKTGVVDLTVPGSAGVRLPATDAETVLKHDFRDSLKDAQTDVKKAADDWRTAEKDVETARHEAQDAINEAAAVLARTDQPLGAAATALNTAIDVHLDAAATLAPLQAAFEHAAADVAQTRATIQQLNPQITSLSQDALTAKDALDDAQLNGAPQAELDRLGQEADAAHTALTDAQQRLTDAHADLDVQRKTAADARAALQAQHQVVAEADAARTAAEEAHQQLVDERAAAENAIRNAETKLDEARRTADAKQQAWWDAKAKVDREVDAFNAAAQAPPAPPAPPVTTTPAPTVRGGGAPPAMTPPTPESHQGKGVLTDESWRHDPAKTADWFAPKDPVDPSSWADRRKNAHTGKVNLVVHDVKTVSTPSNIKSYQGLVNYDLRRIETSPGKFVQEYTVKVHVDPAKGVSPEEIAQVEENATNGVNNLLNQGFRLPSGDQFHLNLEFTENKAEAHTSVKVGHDVKNPDQTHWNPKSSPEVLAHETLHYLGVPDEYSDATRVFQQHDTSSGVHKDDGGLMGEDVHGPDPGLRPRHLWLVERTANSQVAVRDTTLEPAGPATVPPPPGYTPRTGAPTAVPVPDTQPEFDPGAETRPVAKHPREDDSDSPVDDRVTKRQAGTGTWSADAGSSMDVDLDNLADTFSGLSLGDVDFAYNPAFAALANGPVELPTEENHLQQLKKSVEENRQPSFVVNMIVGHGDLGRINDVITSIAKDAGDLKNNMVFVVGVNGKAADNAALKQAIADANAAVSGRTEPIALVELGPVPAAKSAGFPYGKMRNETMTSNATKFAVGAMLGRGTHPYISIQDFDTGSRQVPSGKDVFTHFAESTNSPEAGSIRPLLYAGGYRVGDVAQLKLDVQQRIDKEQAELEADAKLPEDDKNKLSRKDRTKKETDLATAKEEFAKDDFVDRFQQAMRDDMDARVRQSGTSPLLPYSPEPNLFIDAVVPLIDPTVRFSDKNAEFNGLGQSMNEYAAREIVAIHKAKSVPEQDLRTRVADIESGAAVDGATNRNPYRGENFSTDFVNGAVGTDLSRIALDFAKQRGQGWAQSHVEFDTVPGRFLGGPPGQENKAAKQGTSPSDIRKEFQGKQHSDREAQQLRTNTYVPNPDTRRMTHVATEGGWTPSDQDARKLAWQDKNTLNKGVSAPLPDGLGYSGIDPQATPATTTAGPSTDAPAKGKKGKQPKLTAAEKRAAAAAREALLPPINAQTKQHKMAAMLDLALSDNNSNVTRTFGTLDRGVLPIAPAPRPDGLFTAVHEAMGRPADTTPSTLRKSSVQRGAFASTALTTDIARFRQQHDLANGHLVNAFIEPGPVPSPPAGDVAVDNTGTPGRELTAEERAAQDEQDAADRREDNAKAAKAEELAVKLLATEIGRPIRLHRPDGTTTIQPFAEPRPVVTDKSTQKEKKAAQDWRPPVFGPVLDLDAHPNPNGRTSFAPHNPESAQVDADVDMETETRPAPAAPNPAVQTTTVAPGDEATERAEVDVQHNRHPVRGQAFTTDFVAGDTGTDLSRIAYGLIKDGKLPQSHTALPNVSERFLDGKSSKAGTKFAEERERLRTGPHAVAEPLLPPADGQTANSWNPPKKMETQLGAPAKNRLNPAVSAPMPEPFTGQQAGIQKDQKVVAAHGLLASDHVRNTQRQLRYLNEDVLVRQPAPPTSPNGLYAAIGQARGVDPVTLRQQVVSLAATHQAVTRAVADFTVQRPMHQGHLYGALVENINWHMQADANENAGAGNARDLLGHLIATRLSVNVRIHQPGGNAVLLRPMGPPFEETVDVDLVMDGRQVTYRLRQGLQQDVPMH